MNSDRIKEIQETTAYPESVSVKQALLQVWNECEQEPVKNCNIPHVSIALENKRKAFCIWYYSQSQPLDANKVFDWFSNEC